MSEPIGLRSLDMRTPHTDGRILNALLPGTEIYHVQSLYQSSYSFNANPDQLYRLARAATTYFITHDRLTMNVRYNVSHFRLSVRYR